MVSPVPQIASSELHSLFASPEREDMGKVACQAQMLEEGGHLQLINSVNDLVVILNDKRQVVAANENFIGAFKPGDPGGVLGLRPGEAVDCVHAREMAAGCGTTEYCSKCGAAKAILASLRNLREVAECRILRSDGDSVEALDLLVSVTPFSVDGSRFAIMAMTDISHEKRRRALERIFFHDLLNITGGLLGLADLLREGVSEDLKQEAGLIYSSVKRLVQEVTAQKDLAAAECNDLETAPVLLNSRETVRNVAATYANHPDAKGRIVSMAGDCCNVTFAADHGLLMRVLGNMVKNAMEAQKPGDTITVGCRPGGDGRDAAVEFYVHNAAVMDRDVQLQVFQRSFSTKGAGRGLGLYGIKLLTERYLKGKVGFTTGEDGTTFWAALPAGHDDEAGGNA
jgi:signal transduction histidine kinase